MKTITKTVPVTICVRGKDNRGCDSECGEWEHEFDECKRYKFNVYDNHFDRCQECIKEFGTEIDNEKN